MQRRLTTQDLTWFLDINGTGRLDLDPSYQRKSVWTRADRQYFLDTIFNNYPSPAIFLHKDTDDFGTATYHVVDGKQRLETVLLFVDNKLPIRDDIGDTRLAGKKWRDLNDEIDLRRRFWDYQFTVEMLDSIEPAVVNDVFGRLNQNSRKLMPQEIRHSRYDGWFVTFAENQAERPVWKKLRIASTARSRRMQDVQFISELMIVLLDKGISGFDQDYLNEIYTSYEDPSESHPDFQSEDFAQSFEAIAEFLLSCEEQHKLISTHATNFAHFYTLWSWLVLHGLAIEVDAFSSAYGAFMEGVASMGSGQQPNARVAEFSEQLTVYADAARGATTDLRQRQLRQSSLEVVLEALMPK